MNIGWGNDNAAQKGAMMQRLLMSMRSAMSEELARAREKHGMYFSDFPTAWHALAEEAQEADDEFSAAVSVLREQLRSFRCGDWDKMHCIGSSLLIVEKAISAAAEMLQVAVVAQKMLESEGCYAASTESVRKELP